MKFLFVVTAPRLLFVSASLIIIIALFFNSYAQAVTASDWKAGRIIDDEIFFNKSSMSVAQIQQFLDAKVPVCDRNRPSSNPSYQPPWTCLKEYQENTTTKENNIGRFNPDGSPLQISGGKSAAQIIWEVGQAYGINPQVLIVMLQKEQSLITDDWPWKIQYDRAMGYACPDTAPCDEQYYGFYNQVSSAAWQLIRYIEYPDNYNYKVGTNRYILYNPNLSCGGSNVFIENAATAALYNYTPYQPNQGALDNLYGTANCGAYGNRNFWRMFNDWFGSSRVSGFPLTRATSYEFNGDPRQWLIFGNSKYLIPNPDIIDALNLESIPLVNYPGEYLGSITVNSKQVGRIVRPSGSLDVFLADDGNKFRFSSVNMMNLWGYSTESILDVPSYLGLNLNDSGILSKMLRESSDDRVMLMDNTKLRHITDPLLLASFGGQSPSVSLISSNLFNTFTIGGSISNPKILDENGTEYIADGKNLLIMSSKSKQMYPTWNGNIVSAFLINSFNKINAPLILRDVDNPEVYVLDNRLKNHISSPAVLNQWLKKLNAGSVYVSSGGITTLINNGQTINDFLISNNSNIYSLDEELNLIPSNLSQAYKVSTRQVFNVSDNFMSLLPVNQTQLTRYVKAKGLDKVYLITNSGDLMHIGSPDLLLLWGGQNKVKELSATHLNKFIENNGLKAFVNNGSNNYLVQNGKLYSVGLDAIDAWGLTNPTLLDDGTLNDFSEDATIGNSFKSGNFFIIVEEGLAYSTSDIKIAEVWGINTSSVVAKELVNTFLDTRMLGRAAKSNISGDNRQFIVNNGVLYHLSPSYSKNFNINPKELTPVNPEAISKEPISTWSYTILNNNGYKHVIDKGLKRLLPNGVIEQFWRNNSNTIDVSNGFLNLYPSGVSLERAIKGTGNEVYAAEASLKRWIRSPVVYNDLYAPYTIISDELLSLLQQGSDI